MHTFIRGPVLNPRNYIVFGRKTVQSAMTWKQKQNWPLLCPFLANFSLQISLQIKLNFTLLILFSIQKNNHQKNGSGIVKVGCFFKNSGQFSSNFQACNDNEGINCQLWINQILWNPPIFLWFCVWKGHFWSASDAVKNSHVSCTH